MLDLIIPTLCWEEFKTLSFTRGCIEKVIVNGLNFGILAGSVAIKLPQIFKIVTSKSVRGLSESAFVLELISSVTSCLYHTLLEHPFKAWGEMLLISIQCAVQCVLFWIFSKSVQISHRLLGVGIFFVLLIFVLMGGVPVEYYPILGSCPIILSIWSRLPQILLNWNQGHTGQLAIITFGLSGLGNLARVFTTIKQTPEDLVSILSMVVAAVLNFTLVVQIVIYWNKTNKLTMKKKRH